MSFVQEGYLLLCIVKQGEIPSGSEGVRMGYHSVEIVVFVSWSSGFFKQVPISDAGLGETSVGASSARSSAPDRLGETKDGGCKNSGSWNVGSWTAGA